MVSGYSAQMKLDTMIDSNERNGDNIIKEIRYLDEKHCYFLSLRIINARYKDRVRDQFTNFM